jgi:hypothetical protein
VRVLDPQPLAERVRDVAVTALQAYEGSDAQADG